MVLVCAGEGQVSSLLQLFLTVLNYGQYATRADRLHFRLGRAQSKRSLGVSHPLSDTPAVCSTKRVVKSHAYVNFASPSDILDFKAAVHGHSFVTDRGANYRCSVEYAPFQKIPRATSKKDSREGTIEQGGLAPLAPLQWKHSTADGCQQVTSQAHRRSFTAVTPLLSGGCLWFADADFLAFVEKLEEAPVAFKSILSQAVAPEPKQKPAGKVTALMREIEARRAGGRAAGQKGNSGSVLLINDIRAATKADKVLFCQPKYCPCTPGWLFASCCIALPDVKPTANTVTTSNHQHDLILPSTAFQLQGRGFCSRHTDVSLGCAFQDLKKAKGRGPRESAHVLEKGKEDRKAGRSTGSQQANDKAAARAAAAAALDDLAYAAVRPDTFALHSCI